MKRLNSEIESSYDLLKINISDTFQVKQNFKRVWINVIESC